MAERHSGRRQKSRGHFDRVERGIGRVRHVILGIGVDVNLARRVPPELRKLATSLKIESGNPIERGELATEILRELDADYEKICSGKFASIA